MRKTEKKLIIFLIIVLTGSINFAQNVTLPRASQQATISQRSGISDVTISYHSPGVKGRKVFGGIVPYGAIWRAGANENTTIHFTHDATVEGKKIAAGTYGLYMKPDKEGTTLLFSKFHKSWGSVSPAEKDLVLKVIVKNETIPFQEWLSYNFIGRGTNNLTVALQWEKTRVPFKIKFDTSKVIIANFRQELKGLAGFGWRGHMQAANFCLQNDTNLGEAMTWIERSIASSKGFSNLQVKAGLLAKKGNIEEAEMIMKEAIPTGSPSQLNNYGYQLLGMNKTKEAIEVFTYNIEKNPNDPFIWGYTDSLGEAYLKDGNKRKALKYYKLARTKAPQNQHAYLDGVIAKIKQQ